MELIGTHITRAPMWPVSITNPQNVPSSAMFIHTCNRVQYLCEGPERPLILQTLKDSGISTPDIYTGRDCTRKLFEIAFGLDSVNYGNSVIRRQLLEAKNSSGSSRLRNVVSDVIEIANAMVPPKGFRHFESAIKFMAICGISPVHIVTGGEIVGKYSYPIWHPDAFKCEGVILVGRYDERFHEANIPANCKYCINFNTRFDPINFINITHLFDSYVSNGDPIITDVNFIADLYWDKYENSLYKRRCIDRMKVMGISSAEIEHIFSRGTEPSELWP
jgi:hypothetical protein